MNTKKSNPSEEKDTSEDTGSNTQKSIDASLLHLLDESGLEEYVTRSRINKTLKEKTKRNLILLFGAGIILLLVIGFFGMQLLVNLSLLVEKEPETTEQSQQEAFIPPPILDSLPEATNSAEISVSGIAEDGNEAKLYINGKMVKKADIKNDTTFQFRNVRLQEGENTIRVKAASDQNLESDLTEPISVLYLTEPPEVTIDFPSDGQQFNKEDSPIRVRGTTDPDAKVTINEFWAVMDSEGNFSYNLPLKGGENIIRVKAIDKAGNTAEKEVKVQYAE